ncbi:hypothetical protein ABK905_24735 [Acerihabitans sp. KWT182]|uniref:Uncharacterized protein n=1 Tax=Acerihabitans sp. KWT182 TaxID=3157919 RepID=A0AAU7Q968_9GAMM
MLPVNLPHNHNISVIDTLDENPDPQSSQIKMTLQRLRECLAGGCPDLDQLDAAQKETYCHDLLMLYLNAIPSADVEKLPVSLSNNLLLDIENSGDGMVLGIGDNLAIVEDARIQDISKIIRHCILKHVEMFSRNEIYDIISSENITHVANEYKVDNEHLKFFIIEKHKELQILIDAHPDIKQDCFLIAEYLRSQTTDPENFRLPDSLQLIAEMGLQIDFGCLFSGVESDVSINKIAAKIYVSAKNKASLLIRAAEKDLKENINDLCDYIKSTYPQGCILKVGGGVGHYCYYDVPRDILFSGGKNAYDNGMSGLGLREYFARKFNSANTDYKVTLTLTDHDAQEMLDVADIVSEEADMPRERFLN